MKYLTTIIGLLFSLNSEQENKFELKAIGENLYQGVRGDSYQEIGKHIGLFDFYFIGARLRDHGSEICFIPKNNKKTYIICGEDEHGKPHDYQLYKNDFNFLYLWPQEEELAEYNKITQLYHLICKLELDENRKVKFLDFNNNYFKREQLFIDEVPHFVLNFEKNKMRHKFLLNLYDKDFNDLRIHQDVDEINRITHENANKRCSK